jgi:adenosylcobinamide-GDP ribazoletransferase
MSEHLEKARMPPAEAWQALCVDLARCLRFYSRLPVPALPWEHDPHGLPDFPRLTRVLPLAGAVIGLLPALVLIGALEVGLGPWLAATLSVAAMTLTTGAFHEDGLADTADSFGGATRERRLEIMRDSRIGSYGTAALILAFALRIALVSRVDSSAAFAAVVIAALLSRTAGLMPLVLLRPARPDGASYAVGQPTREAFWWAAALSAAMAVGLGLISGLPPAGISLMLVLSWLSGWGLTRLSARHIQGQTGDIAGAAQQVAEIAALIGLLTITGP